MGEAAPLWYDAGMAAFTSGNWAPQAKRLPAMIPAAVRGPARANRPMRLAAIRRSTPGVGAAPMANPNSIRLG